MTSEQQQLREQIAIRARQLNMNCESLAAVLCDAHDDSNNVALDTWERSLLLGEFTISQFRTLREVLRCGVDYLMGFSDLPANYDPDKERNAHVVKVFEENGELKEEAQRLRIEIHRISTDSGKQMLELKPLRDLLASIRSQNKDYGREQYEVDYRTIYRETPPIVSEGEVAVARLAFARGKAAAATEPRKLTDEELVKLFTENSSTLHHVTLGKMQLSTERTVDLCVNMAPTVHLREFFEAALVLATKTWVPEAELKIKAYPAKGTWPWALDQIKQSNTRMACRDSGDNKATAAISFTDGAPRIRFSCTQYVPSQEDASATDWVVLQ